MPLSLSVAILAQTNCSLQDAATGQPGVSRWWCTAHRSHSAFDPLVTTTCRHMSIVRVAFQYDYQCDQIGMFAFLVTVTDFTTAAKCVMALGNPDITLEIRREALTLAAQNPQLVVDWTHDEDGAFHHLADEWCQDLILATLQAVEAKNIVWLGAFLRTFGHEAATTAMRSWHALGCKLASSQKLQELVNGDAFQFIHSGDVQFMWTPDCLTPQRFVPRSHDPTFSARRFRITLWRKEMGDYLLFPAGCCLWRSTRPCHPHEGREVHVGAFTVAPAASREADARTAAVHSPRDGRLLWQHGPHVDGKHL